MKWIKRLAIVVAALVLLASALLWAYSQRTLPTTDGTLRLAGLQAEIRIERDAVGIPTVHARNLDDAMYGLGFVHAQDRLWQLETHRRIAAVRLAEAFGPAALDTDRFLRTLGVQRAAAAQWARASPAARSGLAAYAAGVNAWVDQAMKARPPEFVLLGLQPEPWTPQDSLAWAIMMAWDLGGNWTTELLRMRLALKMPVSRINQLLPPYPGEAPLASADYAALFRGLGVDGRLGQQALNAAPESGLPGVGSNNWVVDGSRSETGHPLLANDPHLKLSTPALWYLARFDVPGYRVAGATLPGLPSVLLGQNEHIAWGFTNTAPDVQDLYLERLKPGDPGQYQTPDGWAPFSSFHETIRVKGAADVHMTVRATRHGPVISDAGVADGLTGAPGKPAYALAMAWTALDPDPGTVDAMLGFNTATSVAEFITASARYLAPMQNMVVADRAGHIAMVSAGRVPVRKADNDLRGLVPSPGWEARYDWAGWIDPGQTPRQADPASGWLGSANQRIVGPEYPHFLTSEWSAPYRMQRIEQLLVARPRHSLDSLAAMQGDQVSLATQRLLPFLRRAQSSHPLAAAAQRELAPFDGTMAAERAAPLIFWAWVRQLTEAVFADDLGQPLFDRTFAGRSLREALEGVLERDDASWCDDMRTPAVETCAQQIDAAFGRALDELQAAQGGEVARWQWGRAHVARSEHRPFSRVKALAPWFELRTPVGGDTFTLNVSRVSLRPDATTGERYLAEHGPSLRALYDVADPSRSRVMFSSGQSGIVFSPLYRNLVQPWAKVEYLPLWSGAAVHTLVLAPAQ